ncbi:MAG: hypothetical protein R3F65_32590 [bacterium]
MPRDRMAVAVRAALRRRTARVSRMPSAMEDGVVAGDGALDGGGVERVADDVAGRRAYWGWGRRVNAVTWWPAARRGAMVWRPVAPVAPKTMTLMGGSGVRWLCCL